jgi:NADPH:quinone reductase-like Zn-dependent oxidoreductase
MSIISGPSTRPRRWFKAVPDPPEGQPAYAEVVIAAYAAGMDSSDPLKGLRVGEIDAPATPPGWVDVTVKAAALNHHDVWSLRGVGLASDRLPMILGCDASGVTSEGRDVVIHAVINDPDFVGSDGTHDPKRSLLSERYPGVMATSVRVPQANLIDKPPELSFGEAACLPTAWLTAYRMLFTQSGLQPGNTVLVQGAGGGVATALIVLAQQAGFRVWVTSRSDSRAARAVDLGASQSFPSGARLPERVDAVMETVGAATWSHSINALKPGGTLVICGATSGDNPAKAELTKIFFKPLRVIGSTMGTRAELTSLTRMLVTTGIRPVINRTLPLTAAREGFAALIDGDVFGKIVFEP